MGDYKNVGKSEVFEVVKNKYCVAEERIFGLTVDGHLSRPWGRR